MYVEPGYTAVDNWDGDITGLVVVEGTVNHTNPGIYGIDYRVSDLSGNLSQTTRVVEVVDQDAPEVSGSLSIVYTNAPLDTDLYAGLTASDPQYGDLTHKITIISNNVNWLTSGVYQVVYEVSDYSGLSTQVSRSVSIAAGGLYYPAFSNWMARKAAIYSAGPSNLGRNDDPDLDGFLNWEEWLAETDPFDETSLLELYYAHTNNNEEFSWVTAERISYRLAETTNIFSWSTEPVTTRQGDGTCIYYKREISGEGLHRSYRIEAHPSLPIEP